MSETKGYRSKSGSRAENAFEWLEVHSKPGEGTTIELRL